MKPGFQYPFAFSFRQEADFATFLPGNRNALVHDYLQTFNRHQDRYCLVWGALSTGKTHLLQALCQLAPEAVYLPLRELAPYGPELLTGLESSQMLVLDDVDVILSDQLWEEQLFRLFNAVAEQGGQLCMSTTLPLVQTPFVLPDLQSRLQLATGFELQQPEDEVRRLILEQLAARRGISLKPEVVDYLLLRSQRDMAGLCAMLNQLDQLSLAELRRVTIPFIRETLGW